MADKGCSIGCGGCVFSLAMIYVAIWLIKEIWIMKNNLKYYIKKDGWYYRPESKGYTNQKREAGQFSHNEMLSHMRHCDELTFEVVSESELKPDPKPIPYSFRQLAHQILSDPENASRLDVDILSSVLYKEKSISMKGGIAIGLVLGIIIGLML